MTDRAESKVEEMIARAKESAAIWQRLMNLVDARDKELEDDPKRLFEMALKELDLMHGTLTAAYEALLPHFNVNDVRETALSVRMKTFSIQQDEYDRLKASERIIRAWHAACAERAMSRTTGPAKPS